MKKGKSPAEYSAECMTCGWQLVSANALGVGAIHAKSHKHLVLVDNHTTIHYDGREE